MRRLALLLLPLFILALISPVAQAKPASGFCSGTFCTASWVWGAGGFNHGLQAVVSDPSVTTIQSGNADDIEIEDCDTSTCSHPSFIGLEFRGSSPMGGFCNGSGSGSFYFYHSMNGSNCIPVPAGDHGHPATLIMGYYTSGNGGMFFEVISATGHPFCGNACFIDFDPQSYTGAVTYDTDQGGALNGWTTTQFGIHHFDNNKYQNSSAVWTYVHSNPALGFNDKPPNSSWTPAPTLSSTGGEWTYCMEANTNTFC